MLLAVGENSVMTDGSPRRVGRPSMSVERQRQIVDAFIDLVAERGLERVTLDDVARVAGVQRAALRHFVGNREELILAAVDELARRYEVSAAEMGVGETPAIDELITLLFSDELTRDQPVETAAFNALLAEAIRRPAARGAIIKGYDMLLDQMASALRREYPSAPTARIRDTAYVILCMVEQNTTFQQLGYPRSRQFAARSAARHLVGHFAAEFGMKPKA